MMHFDRATLVRMAFAASVLLTLGVASRVMAEDGSQPQGSPPQEQGSAPNQAHSGNGDHNRHYAPGDTSEAAIKAAVQRRLDEMATQLKLTDVQRGQLRPIVKEQMQQMRQLRIKYSGQQRTPDGRAAMAKEMKAIQESHDELYAQVLSADQMTQLRQMREQNRDRMKNGGPPQGDPQQQQQHH